VIVRQVKTKSKTLEVATVASSYHVEINPSDAGNNDTHVIQEIIKDLAMTQSVSAVAKMGALSAGAVDDDEDTPPATASGTVPPFKVVVLHEVDRLSADAQHGLRRTMEQYTQSCRLILCCESACRVAAPLKSRCLLVRVPSPSTAEMLAILAGVARKQKIELPGELAEAMAAQSQGNVRKAVLMLEATATDQYPFTAGQGPRRPDWEVFVEDIARLVLEEQSAQRLLLVRGKLYELLTNCIPADTVIKTLTEALLAQSSAGDEVQAQTLQWAAFYEHRMRTGSKPLFHIEAFLAKFMAVYKKWALSRMR
jgi:replication factor C subunit 3/5